MRMPSYVFLRFNSTLFCPVTSDKNGKEARKETEANPARFAGEGIPTAYEKLNEI